MIEITGEGRIAPNETISFMKNHNINFNILLVLPRRYFRYIHLSELMCTLLRFVEKHHDTNQQQTSTNTNE